jgi:hypothetical protein
MSQFISHPASSIKLSFAARKAAWLLSLVALLAVLVTAAILLASNGSSSSSSASPVTNTAVPSARYDGGPDEGTVGITGHRHGGGFTERYDGGPEEGSAGH